MGVEGRAATASSSDMLSGAQISIQTRLFRVPHSNEQHVELAAILTMADNFMSFSISIQYHLPTFFQRFAGCLMDTSIALAPEIWSKIGSEESRAYFQVTQVNAGFILDTENSFKEK